MQTNTKTAQVLKKTILVLQSTYVLEIQRDTQEKHPSAIPACSTCTAGKQHPGFNSQPHKALPVPWSVAWCIAVLHLPACS